jgi:hypothetical protein
MSKSGSGFLLRVFMEVKTAGVVSVATWAKIRVSGRSPEYPVREVVTSAKRSNQHPHVRSNFSLYVHHASCPEVLSEFVSESASEFVSAFVNDIVSELVVI